MENYITLSGCRFMLCDHCHTHKLSLPTVLLHYHPCSGITVSLLGNAPKSPTYWAEQGVPTTVSHRDLCIFVLLYHIDEKGQSKFPNERCGRGRERAVRQANKAGEHHTAQWSIWTFLFVCVFFLFSFALFFLFKGDWTQNINHSKCFHH